VGEIAPQSTIGTFVWEYGLCPLNKCHGVKFVHPVYWSFLVFFFLFCFPLLLPKKRVTSKKNLLGLIRFKISLELARYNLLQKKKTSNIQPKTSPKNKNINVNSSRTSQKQSYFVFQKA